MPRTFIRPPSAATAIALIALFAALSGSGYAAVHLDRGENARIAQGAGISDRFSFLAGPGTDREILNLAGVTIRARCTALGDLRVDVDVTGGGQLQSASTSTSDDDATAFNETRRAFPGGAADILPVRDFHQLGHTEIARQSGGSVSLDWQADNPGLPWPVSPNTTTTHRCVFTGNAVLGG
jgi:hypothetical protein